ncbi:MAG TPA: serine/threonine-protein kinase, partial [Polyangiaceae bacterium]|nr:serine/threonine-protein kinase [Polyangiaceae bacterium]
MSERDGARGEASTRTSEIRPIAALGAGSRDERSPSRSEHTSTRTLPLEPRDPDAAAIDFARERERVLSRAEHVAAGRRLAKALRVGIPLWLGSFVMDAYVLHFASMADPRQIVAIRLAGALAAFGVLWRLGRPTPPSPRQLWLLDVGIFTLASVMGTLLALSFGGITSPYATGIIVILVARGATLLAPWRSAALSLGIPALAFPLVALVAACFDARIAAQFVDPAQLGVFLIFLCFMGMAWLHLTQGADFAWRLRREAIETRNIGRYKLERRLGGGGMGDVWAAYDLALKHRVALKTVSGHRPGSSALARLEREARALAELAHPNTVRVFDYGVTDDGLWYYAMELLHGENLRERVVRAGPLSAERLLHVGRQVLRALGEAHAKGIVHRDIKPENVFVAELGGESDVAKLLDFGIAKANLSDEATLTHTGHV